MRYFKNTELAKIYNVSEKSVRNWINAAKEGKLDLQLFDNNGRLHIANVTKNTEAIEKLVANGKKYKNSRGYKVVTPSEDFYKLYSKKQILDIISSLDIHHESPIQYTYFDGGAIRWDKHVQKMATQNGQNSLNSTLQVLQMTFEYLDKLAESYDRVNIVDIGVGNAMPIRSTIDHFLQNNKMGSYIGIDISNELLDISSKNIAKWFNGEVKIEKYIRDITYERFNDLLTPENFSNQKDKTLNLIYFIGGTISNFREPDKVLSTIHDSMDKNDIIIFTKKLDTAESRRYFDMVGDGNQDLEMVLRLSGICPSMYHIETAFDERTLTRMAHAVLDVSLSVKYDLYGSSRDIEFNKDDRILLWRAKHQSSLDVMRQFDRSGFNLLSSIKSKERDYFGLVSTIKTTSP